MPNRAIDTPQWKAGTNKQAPIVEMYPDFEPGSFSFKGVTRPVYKSGEGPAIIVIHEIPGIYDEVWNFARRLNKEGFTTYLPSLIGSPGMSYSTRNLLKAPLINSVMSQRSLWRALARRDAKIKAGCP